MNKHFEDARYYLKRAGKTATQGVKEEVEPIRERVRSLTGKDEEPEPSRIDKIRDDLESIEQRAEGEAKEAIGEARSRLKAYRDSSN